MKQDDDYILGQLIHEDTSVTFEELCRLCMLQTEEIIELIHEGIIEPLDGRPGRDDHTAWEFHVSSVRRVRTVVHLQRDLGVNLPGAALAIELLDRIEKLQR
jgi:chaperone modulatory protein CbpM